MGITTTETDRKRLKDLRGRLIRSENGHIASTRSAFEAGALVGFHLTLPRQLGTFSATLELRSDDGGCFAALPFTFRLTEGGEEEYALLLDSGVLTPHGPLFFARIRLKTAYGELLGGEAEGGEIVFGTDVASCGEIRLFLPEYAYAAPAFLAGNILYACPPVRGTGISAEISDGDRTAQDTWIGRALRLGAGVIFLTAGRAGEGREEIWRADRVLNEAVRNAAMESDIRILPDFWLASGVRNGIGLFSAPSRSIQERRLPADEVPAPEACGTAPIGPGEEEHRRPCCDHFCGRDGVVSSWLKAGVSGFVVGAADGVGDAFLSAVRARMQEEACRPALLGAVCGDPILSIAFGVRRRFLSGEELDGLLLPMLRPALLSYLPAGEPSGLRRFLGETLRHLPLRALHTSCHSLSDGEGTLFSESLRADQEGKTHWATYAALAYLIAATLPGNPVISAGEETGGVPETQEGEWLLAYYLRVSALRRREAVYREGGFRLLHLSREALVFSREREGEALLTVVNRADAPMRLWAAGGFTVILGGRGRKTAFRLAPRSGAVCRFSFWPGEASRLTLELQSTASPDDESSVQEAT